MSAEIDSLLEAALEAPFGIAVLSADIEHLRREFNLRRGELRKSGINLYDNLLFRTNPSNLLELYLIHKEPPKGDAAQ